MNKNRKILLTGGSGRLGSIISSLVHCDAPSSRELDITNPKKCRAAIKKYKPDIIIHCAGYVNSFKAEVEQKKCWELNVIGTKNMIEAAEGRRFIHISSDYVFDGEKGKYKEEDLPNPVNFYGLTKFGGEVIVAQYPNSLIIRAPFRPDGPWGYPKAFIDQWTSCVVASKRAPDIIKAALNMNLKGILHIGGRRQSIYEMAKSVSPKVGKIKRSDFGGLKLPKDTSLNDSKWKKVKSK